MSTPNVVATCSLSRGKMAERMARLDHPCSRREFAARSWEHGYCAYAPRHGRLLERLVGLLADAPGLELAGDYVRGASIEACFRSARECAARVRAAAGVSPGAGGF